MRAPPWLLVWLTFVVLGTVCGWDAVACDHDGSVDVPVIWTVPAVPFMGSGVEDTPTRNDYHNHIAVGAKSILPAGDYVGHPTASYEKSTGGPYPDWRMDTMGQA
ncbi:hypothetical protein KIPB_007337 [Kipferlia bialata]|uniref:DUF1996 domain-containing protein n=1 Tax=Kipferlia bialata TaxID=797122 RepID=A0A9K3GKH9_9EUKA|nr:hypothetical protein KIPB_007337 [Kipferlia bialata]|eukprot:g7337.t1